MPIYNLYSFFLLEASASFIAAYLVHLLEEVDFFNSTIFRYPVIYCSGLRVEFMFFLRLAIHNNKNRSRILEGVTLRACG